MSSESRDKAATRWESAVDTHKKVIAEALEAATAGSVISSVDEVTAKTEDGQELKMTTRPGARGAKAELVSGGKTIDAAPSGTFTLVGGDKLTIEKGRVVGRPEPGDIRAWAMFALMPADRQIVDR
jgi:hypothetical protein